MEDAHIAVLELGNTPDTAMFGVFDGHGGRRVNLLSDFLFCYLLPLIRLLRLKQKNRASRAYSAVTRKLKS